MLDEFARLQAGLAEVWPVLTLRSREATARTNIVVHSLSNDPPAHLAPVLPAYEERFLCLLLGLPVHDCTAGFRCYRREVLENIGLDDVKSQGYGFQVE